MATEELGRCYCFGKCGVPKDLPRAFELFTEAAELGSIDAHFHLGNCYLEGNGVEKDLRTAMDHYKIAAKGGHPFARFSLGVIEFNAGKFDRALKHYMISTKMGDEGSLNKVKVLFMGGHATKEDYKEALVGFRDTTDGMKSLEREEAKALMEEREKAKKALEKRAQSG